VSLPTAPAGVAPPAPTSAAAARPAPPHDQVYREAGIASWYGGDLHGRTTANGETFDMYGISASHRTLPLGTVVRVTNLDNFKRITVRINDRGPFARTRAMVLSYRAAVELAFVPQGMARVRIETFEPVRGDAVYTVHAAAFVEEERAKTLKRRLQAKYETVYLVPWETNFGKFHCVRVGMYPSEEKA